MDLLGSLDESSWKNVNPEELTGWEPHLVLKGMTTKDDRRFEYIIQMDGEESLMRRAQLEGAAPKTNPLQYVRRVELKLLPPRDDLGLYSIVAMNLDGDCVARK